MSVIFTLISFIMFFSFPVKKSLGDGEENISGRYINQTFLNQLPDSITGTIPFYCLEINFTGSDSAGIYNGFEEFKLAYKKSEGNYVFTGAMQGKDLSFILEADGNILLIDSVWTGIPAQSDFVKVSEDDYTQHNNWVFEKYLNEKMIAGNYFLYDGNKSTGQQISFTSDGKVTGLKDFTSYSICFSGDCTTETAPVSNTITFKNSSGVVTTYSFKFDKENNSVVFYNIAEPVKDIKGEREIKEKSFELMR